jgi:uncharacterized membrane protein
MLMKSNRAKVKKLVYLAVLTAAVVILQFAGQFIHLGAFNISLSLIPIVLAAALCGPFAAAWIGGVSAFVILVSGQAALFLAIDPAATVFIVLAKGILSGLGAGYIYKLLERFNKYLATLVAAIVCPVINTGIFTIGCFAFFIDGIAKFVAENNLGMSASAAVFLVFIGGNFFVELAFNIILSPSIVRIVSFAENEK